MTDATVQTAKLTITYNGQQGDLPDEVDFHLAEAAVKQIATEVVRAGGIAGIDADPNANFTDFVVDSYPSREDLPINRLVLRPKTPFGCN
jgi:hypothetical protein